MPAVNPVSFVTKLKFNIPSYLPDYTSRMVKYLLGFRGEGNEEWIKTESGYRRTRFPFKHLAIFGKQDSGKTEFCNWLAWIFREFYGKENVNILHGKRFGTLLSAINSQPYQLMIVDDAVEFAQSRRPTSTIVVEDIIDFDAVRHIARAKGCKHLPIIFISQRFKSLETSFRDAYCIVFKTSATDEADADLIRRYLGNSAYSILENITYNIYERNDDSAKAFSIVHFGAARGSLKVGFIRSSYVLETIYNYVGDSEDQIERERNLEAYKIIDHYAGEIIKKFSNKTVTSSLVRGYLLENYSGKWQELERYVNDIAALIKIRSMSKKKAEEKKEILVKATAGQLVLTDFRECCIDYCKERFGQEAAQAVKYIFERYIDGDKEKTQEWIAGEIYGDPSKQREVSRLFDAFREDGFGYVFEIWFKGKNGLGQEVSKQGEPDYIKGDDIKSLKARLDRRSCLAINPMVDCKPEWDEAIKRKSEFTVVLTNPYWENWLQETKKLPYDNLPKSIAFSKDRDIEYLY